MRGVRGTRTGVGDSGVVGNAVDEDGPALPFSLEVDVVGVDGSLTWEMRLLRTLTCVPARGVMLEPFLCAPLVSLGCLFNVFVASRGSAIQISPLRSQKSVFEERDKLSGTPSLRFSAGENEDV